MNATALQLCRLNLKSDALPPKPTLKAIADTANLSAGNLSSWERGEKPLGARSLMTISALYGETVEVLEELYDRCRHDWLLEEIAVVQARMAARAKSRRRKPAKKGR